ncbi:hypothetical protein C8J57DRAFT_1461089 [Mycena rebaudengoi]|nr:hypothetical protein C8J57DRAFT_1461089 [Mycena rebaudengoi]
MTPVHPARVHPMGCVARARSAASACASSWSCVRRAARSVAWSSRCCCCPTPDFPDLLERADATERLKATEGAREVIVAVDDAEEWEEWEEREEETERMLDGRATPTDEPAREGGAAQSGRAGRAGMRPRHSRGLATVLRWTSRILRMTQILRTKKILQTTLRSARTCRRTRARASAAGATGGIQIVIEIQIEMTVERTEDADECTDDRTDPMRVEDAAEARSGEAV